MRTTHTSGAAVSPASSSMAGEAMSLSSACEACRSHSSSDCSDCSSSVTMFAASSSAGSFMLTKWRSRAAICHAALDCSVARRCAMAVSSPAATRARSDSWAFAFRIAPFDFDFHLCIMRSLACGASLHVSFLF